MQIRAQRPSHDRALVIRRAAATDPALSVIALGILTRVLASPDKVLTLNDLTAMDASPAAVHAGLEQLRTAGYLIVDAEDVYRVSDIPQPPPGIRIAASTAPYPPRPALTPVPDLPQHDPLPPAHQPHPTLTRDTGRERPPDPTVTARAAKHGAKRVREELARAHQEQQTRLRRERERLEQARQARAETNRVAHEQELNAVRTHVDQQVVGHPTAGPVEATSSDGRSD